MHMFEGKITDKAVMLTGTEITTTAVMASKGIKMGSQQPTSLQVTKFGPSGEKSNALTNAKEHTEGGCSHCGNKEHTCETCFKLKEYPEWWKELKAQRQRSG